MIRRAITWGLGGLLGLFLIYSLYDRFLTTTVLERHEEAFQHLEHPGDTALIDAFQFKFSYYPATYRDESIRNRCAYLVGEIRSYSGNWDALQAFYEGQKLAPGNTDELYVSLFPVALSYGSGTSSGFDLENNFSYSPFDVDVLARLESHYYFWGFPKELNESRKNIYTIYIAPPCK